MRPPGDAVDLDMPTTAPTTPPRQRTTAARTNAPTRQSQSDKAPSRKVRENSEIGNGDNDEPGKGTQPMGTGVGQGEMGGLNDLVMRVVTMVLLIAMQDLERKMIEMIEIRLAVIEAKTVENIA